MTKKTVNISSKRIEQKITVVTSILGIIVMNVIWFASSESMKEMPQTVITQNEHKTENDKDVNNNQILVSYTQAKLNY